MGLEQWARIFWVYGSHCSQWQSPDIIPGLFLLPGQNVGRHRVLLNQIRLAGMQSEKKKGQGTLKLLVSYV